jgi:hypothetical protein
VDGDAMVKQKSTGEGKLILKAQAQHGEREAGRWMRSKRDGKVEEGRGPSASCGTSIPSDPPALSVRGTIQEID